MSKGQPECETQTLQTHVSQFISHEIFMLYRLGKIK